VLISAASQSSDFRFLPSRLNDRPAVVHTCTIEMVGMQCWRMRVRSCVGGWRKGRPLGSELYVLAHALELGEDFGEEARLRVDPQHGAAGKENSEVRIRAAWSSWKREQ
jgi:hypothetical protein